VLRKKLRPGLRQREEEVKPKRKLPPPPPEDQEVEVEEEDLEGEDEDLEEEEPTPKLKKKLAEPEEDEEEVLPTKRAKILGKKGGTSSRKDAITKAFANTPLSNNEEDLPKGLYDAILSELVLQDFEDGKGQFVRTKYELCTPDFEGRIIPQWWKILDKDGKPIEFPFQMMKEALAKLGYNPKDYDELQEVCEEVTDQKPGVSIKISYQEYQGSERVRVTIQGEQDNDVIQEYKDSVPY
jgi:hypothetical protein